MGAIRRSHALLGGAGATKAFESVVKSLIGSSEFVSEAATTPNVTRIMNPATGMEIGKVPHNTQDELKSAVEEAQAAFPAWRDTPIQQRQRVMFAFQQLIRDNHDKLALCITEEQGKSLADARGDVFRGLEVVEAACGASQLMMGRTLTGLGKGVDCHSFRHPLGVCAGISPMNFPAMLPLWMFPLAAVTGNTYVLKPTEVAPRTSMMLAMLAREAGLPPGVLNIVHGGKEAVSFLCQAPQVKAISFVGSTRAGLSVHAEASHFGKRVQTNLGAKNHAVLMPDAHLDSAIPALVGAAFGAAGQRCMAISVLVFVGRATMEAAIPRILEEAKKLKVTGGMEPDCDIGPMISEAAQKRAEGLIARGVEMGAELLLDGRGVRPSGYEGGHFLGPTVLLNAGPGNPAYDEEIFAPALCCLCADSIEEAIALVNANPMGNGTALFTSSGAVARKYEHEIDVGQVRTSDLN
jgi:malonate-semialdehyde dehydrogenase (acetylating)/methylmalonate-semialdehyde dehydrogenase